MNVRILLPPVQIFCPVQSGQALLKLLCKEFGYEVRYQYHVSQSLPLAQVKCVDMGAGGGGLYYYNNAVHSFIHLCN